MTMLTTHPDDQAAERIAAGTVVTDYAGDALVLGYTTGGDVELCRDDASLTTQPASLALVRQHDPARQQYVWHQAVTALDAERRQLVTDHAWTLDRIRSAAIEKHQDGGEICREGLNDFLRELGLAEYGPRMRVDFTVRGSYEVDTTDDYEARVGAEDHLGVDLADIGEANEDSLTHKVEVTNVETIGH
jgi:hypothetical protein